MSSSFVMSQLVFDECTPNPIRSVGVSFLTESGKPISLEARATHDDIFVVTPVKISKHWFQGRK